MLGLYLEGLRILMFQLSGFYYCYLMFFFFWGGGGGVGVVGVQGWQSRSFLQ